MTGLGTFCVAFPHFFERDMKRVSDFSLSSRASDPELMYIQQTARCQLEREMDDYSRRLASGSGWKPAYHKATWARYYKASRGHPEEVMETLKKLDQLTLDAGLGNSEYLRVTMGSRDCKDADGCRVPVRIALEEMSSSVGST